LDLAPSFEAVGQSEEAVFESQVHNHSLVMYDKDWIEKFDFSIPPPDATLTPMPTTPMTPLVTPMTQMFFAADRGQEVNELMLMTETAEQEMASNLGPTL